jgi:hypothetical protein
MLAPALLFFFRLKQMAHTAIGASQKRSQAHAYNPPSPSRVRWVQTDSKAVAARAKVLQYDIVADLHLTADFKGDRA